MHTDAKSHFPRRALLAMLSVLLLCAGFTGLYGGTAHSQPPPDKPQPSPVEDRFKQMDKNGDGKITPDEFPNAEAFKQIDANGDGAITLEELKAFFAKQGNNGGGQPNGGAEIEQRFKQMDKNGDGKITPDEFPNAEAFKQIDANGDGAITLEEMKAFFAKQNGGNNGGGQGNPNANVEREFKLMDKDGDGKLTPQEFPNADLFKQIDANGDGFVTLDELKAFIAKRQANGGGNNGGNNGGGQGDQQANIEREFKLMDKDGDGKLSPQELPNAQLFKQIDANGDGFITLDEAKAFFAKQAGQGKPPFVPAVGPDKSLPPLTDLGKGQYQGFAGGLYPDGANTPPPAYLTKGLAAAKTVQPLDKDGKADANGAVVLLSIGMSNTTMEFTAFKRKADADAMKNPRLTVVDGAQGGQDAVKIKDPAAPFWGVVDNRLTAAGVNGKQVQVVWLKEAIAGENKEFPADAKELQDDLNAIIKILRDRYPNLKLIYISSRIYAGFATTPLNPEPFAYQGGFAVKWCIEERIKANADGPWVAWGPYLWTDGARGRADKLTWAREDVGQDGTHPSASGCGKVTDLLLQFFKTDETAKGWFLR